MSFKWETNKTSNNKTENSQVFATWGRPRTIEAIAVHWWGDPNNNPSFDGIVDYLCRPNGGSSAHLVATGTNRRVACIVDFDDASWATNSANPYTISIECDPRCRTEDYDVVAELIAQLRQVFGNLPLVPHRQFTSTACPGNYDLGRLDREARVKVAKPEWDWGHVENKVVEAPKPTTPAPVTDNLYRLIIDNKQVAAYSTEKNAYSGYVYYGGKGVITYKFKDVTKTVFDKYKPALPKPVETPHVPSEPTVSPDQNPSQPESGTDTHPVDSNGNDGGQDSVSKTTLWQDILKWFNSIVTFLSKYKRNK